MWSKISDNYPYWKTFVPEKVLKDLFETNHYSLPLQNDIKNCQSQIESLQSQYKSRMDSVKETVASKTAVPTSQVYVSFESCFPLQFPQWWWIARFKANAVFLNVLCQCSPYFHMTQHNIALGILLGRKPYENNANKNGF